jgi:CheY-like chemotaxis protein
VLLDLAVNGRDAMLTRRHGHPGAGGTLAVAVDAAPAPPDDAGPGAAARRWARLRVRDTGHGMDAATQAHLFEPFFTTKDVGVGTGLGLASAHGIVSQAGGAIQVESAPGAGACFTVLLPAVDDAPARPAAAAPAAAAPAAPGGRPRAAGTLLLVEDEAPVRATVRRMLERAGYAVREAAHGRDALDAWAAHRGEVVAVVTDVRMPVMGGRALAERLRAQAPGLPVVFMSGYTDDAPEAGGGAPDAFVAKPFASDALLAALRQLLGAGHAA